jgi:hypothetical protein
VVGITVGTVIALAAAVIAFVAAAANWVGSLLDAIGDDGDDPDVRVGRAESRAWSSRRYALLT